MLLKNFTKFIKIKNEITPNGKIFLHFKSLLLISRVFNAIITFGGGGGGNFIEFENEFLRNDKKFREQNCLNYD